MTSDHTPRPLEEYGLVGDTETLAIAHESGSIDWMCWPRFDSPSVFGALLDDDGGSWTLQPSSGDDGVESRQVYLSGTNVLLTRFHTPTGIVEVEDFMSIDTVDDDDRSPGARHLIRVVRCRGGRVEVRSSLRMRPDYGRGALRAERRSARPDDDDVTSITLTSTGDHAFELNFSATATIDITGDENRVDLDSTFELVEDETVFFSIGESELTVAECVRRHRRTLRYWRDWSAASTYQGRWREHVERSALTLKLLTHRPTGGIIAAPTTSLPEVIGGERNWDYRYVWIRDAAFTLYAFIELGYLDEAEAFTAWLVGRVHGCDTSAEHPPLSPVYDLDGNADIAEIELDHWSGYAGSRPVRVGNAASGQLQLDIYGEMIDALYLADKHGDGLSLKTWDHVCVIVDWVLDNWQRPDDGIWEPRRGEQRHTSSLLMCWVAVERAMRMARRRGRPGPYERWRAERDAMHACLLAEGWNEDLAAFTQTLGGSTLDASLLLMPLVRFVSPTDERWLSTLDAIGEQLAHGPLVDRYDMSATDDGLDGDEGSFTICSFWYVETLARAGRVDEARSMFDRLLSYASPTGLLSEEIGPNGRLIGNFPQAFSHLALISTAVHLDESLP
jgi:GH15 family glucan-1,4-alpha-glucosidase